MYDIYGLLREVCLSSCGLKHLFLFASVFGSHIMFLFVCQGDQARNFFLQSGLPPPILAQIWWVTSIGSYNQLWDIGLKITQWWSFTLWSIHIYLKLFFFFLFFLWRALADMNSDGRMDIHEFSIAMKLIKLKLQGHPLPPSLPPSMKQPPLPLPPPGGFGKTEKKTHNVLRVLCNYIMFMAADILSAGLLCLISHTALNAIAGRDWL